MKTHKLFIIILFVFLLPTLFSSCNDNRRAEDILFSITKDIDDLPDGNVYLKSADEGSECFLSPMIISALYGEGAVSYEFSLIEDFAVYLSSFKTPCEVAVYKCYSASDTDLIASMCLSRIENLKIILAETSFSETLSNATVSVSGKFVIVTMLP